MVVKRFHIYTSIYLEEKKLEKWLSDRKNLSKLFRDKSLDELKEVKTPAENYSVELVESKRFSIK